MKEQIKKQLSSRLIRFLAIGSAIGTGLFYGSSSSIQLAGPSVILAYLIGGAAVYIVMRCLGEMAVHKPISGSFGQYASEYISPLVGFLTGCTYVLEMAVVCLADVIVFGVYMSYWYPDVAQWIWISGIIVLIGSMNLLRAKIFGEVEFWLSIIKVSAIVGMIIGGLIIILFGLKLSEQPSGITNLWQHGGFFPNGIKGLMVSLTVVMFAYGGIEVIGITAGEAANPAQAIPKAINAVPIRILLFYILTMVVLMSIFPWSKIDGKSSPFVQIFAKLGIHSAAGILNLVVIVAVVSAINSDIYSVGRMLYGMAQQKQAPQNFMHLSKQGVPYVAVLAIMLVLGSGVLLTYHYRIPEKTFIIIMSIASFATLWVWVAILISEIQMRRQMSKDEVASLLFPVPWWPTAPLIASAFMCMVIAMLAYLETTRVALYTGSIWIATLTALFYIHQRGWLVKRDK